MIERLRSQWHPGYSVTVWLRKQRRTAIGISRFACITVALLFAGSFAGTLANAQSSQNPSFGVGPVDRGLVVGVIVGVVAVASVGITYLVLHNRGVVVGCIAEAAGKETLVGSDKKVYSLLDGGLQLPVGERTKLKGHKSGQSPALSFRVEKVVKDYGHCQP
jgi:hypothetical protein